MKPQIHTDAHRSEGAETELRLLTEKVIGCAFQVQNALGSGFLEKVYENALRLELRAAGIHVQQQVPLRVWYRDEPVGEYCADLLVENRVLVELKAQKRLDEVHQAQCLNYLKATGFPICLLLNFGRPRVEVKRLRL